MYKDKDKQKEANRQAKMRQREREGMTITLANVIPDVIPEHTAQGNIRVSKPGDADYEPECETTRAFVEDRPKTESVADLGGKEHSMDCDPDTLAAFNESKVKRGKDIKCFADLPSDVQKTIDRMSINKDGTINQTTKANRTAIAIHYQHLFPDRYYSTGVA